jgi:hypothetical protein
MNNSAGPSRPNTARATRLPSPGNETNFLLRPGPLKERQYPPPPLRSGAARRDLRLRGGVEASAAAAVTKVENEREARQQLPPCMTASTHKASCYEGPHSSVLGHPLRQHLRCPSPFPPGKPTFLLRVPSSSHFTAWILLRSFFFLPFSSTC